MKKDFTYKTLDGFEIPITVYGIEKFDKQPCLIYCHGFKGFKDWGFVPYAGEFFAKNGFSFVSFNFSHNGIGKDLMEFTELDKFEKNTFSREVQEAGEIIELVIRTNFFGKDLNHNLGLIGHSRGGGVALLAGAQSLEVSAVCTWSSVCTFDRYDKNEKANWRKLGYKEVVNSRTGQTFKMGMDMLRDIETNVKDSLNVQKATKNLAKPLKILHGQLDETVSFYEAETLNIYANPMESHMQLVPGAGHTYGVKHPFEGTTKELDLLLNLSLTFFKDKMID